MPSSVSIFRVTKLRSGEHTMRRASVIFMADLRALSLVDAAGEIAAVDGEDLPGDETAFWRGEINRCAGDFIHCSEPRHRCAHDQFPAASGVEKLAIEFGGDNAWCDGVYGNAMLGPLYRQRPG